ncbi:MAG: hypothetical protein V5B07_05335 [Candidatus Accumulibacter sp. UW27]|jgi:hypothetical protein
MSFAVSRFQADRLFLGCAAEGAVLLARAARKTSSGSTLLASARTEMPTGKPSTRALCAALQGLTPGASRSGACAVTVDDGFVRFFVVTPPSGTQGLRELEAIAAARFAALYGESTEAWRLTADWQATAPFIACALPRELQQAIEALAQRQGARLHSLSPALARAWHRLRPSIPDNGWLLVGFGQTLTLVYHHPRQPVGVRSLCFASSPSLAELDTLLEQERLRRPGDGGAPPSLLWAGAADWLPEVTTIAGLSSRTLPWPGPMAAGSGLPAAEQLALAGEER